MYLYCCCYFYQSLTSIRMNLGLYIWKGISDIEFWYLSSWKSSSVLASLCGLLSSCQQGMETGHDGVRGLSMHSALVGYQLLQSREGVKRRKCPRRKGRGWRKGLETASLRTNPTHFTGKQTLLWRLLEKPTLQTQMVPPHGPHKGDLTITCRPSCGLGQGNEPVHHQGDLRRS